MAIAAWAAATPRHLWALSLLVILAVGCRFPGVDTQNPNYHYTTPPVTNAPALRSPPIPQATPRPPRPRALLRAPLTQPVGTLLPIAYPPNAADFQNWNTEQSTDGGKTWVVFGPDYKYSPAEERTNIIEVKATNSLTLFRMHGWNFPLEPWVLEANATSNWVADPNWPGDK